MPAKPTRGAQAAERTRAWREARRQAGFVKIEVWAPAACKPDILSAVQAIVVESARGPALKTNPNPPKGVRHMDSVIDTAWTIHTLRDGLVESSLVREDEMTVTVVEGVEPVLLVVMHEFGDLPIYVSGGGLQLVVSTLLWPCDEQNDRAAFNEFLLKAQKIVPLSNFGITTIEGRDYYELMGEISSKTTLQTLLIELRTLADNAIAAASDLRDTFEKSRGAAA
ncbi:YjfI family protein [Caulobacter segnis]|uniref:YjfI family protein n=1 Tax=Caulobacter segnis TaxID=88688 RepID=UPI00286AF12F|nr:YjfI family protein [Caulobacter segnis]